MIVLCCQSSVSSKGAPHLLPNPTLTLTFQRRVRPHLPSGRRFRASHSIGDAGRFRPQRRTAEAALPPQPAALGALPEMTSVRRWHSAHPRALSFPRGLPAGRPRGLQFLASGFIFCASFPFCSKSCSCFLGPGAHAYRWTFYQHLKLFPFCRAQTNLAVPSRPECGPLIKTKKASYNNFVFPLTLFFF